MYKNYSNLDDEISDESTDKADVGGCRILDGKRSRHRKSIRKNKRSRRKSIRYKKK